MENEDKLSLTLIIEGRKYPLKINRSEEQAFRDAGKKINNKINQYRVAFGDSPDLISQDFIAMTAIQVLVENFSLGQQNYTQPYEDKINSLIVELDQYLKE
ncbi:MAG: cell division protein ZapA [Dysgonamonadaceae bacterium]|nr:cell division protein ZapA [Dysgonamonadaceae bacterium]MDD4728441.1 cell division protein ZapA [Dysgonamonadaceae bacterium]